MYVLDLEIAELRKTKLEVRREPVGFYGVTILLQILSHVLEIAPDKMRQHPAIMNVSSPPDQAVSVRPLPKAGDESAHQQLLGQAHAGMRRHFEGAHLDKTQSAGTALRGIKFIDAELR